MQPVGLWRHGHTVVSRWRTVLVCMLSTTRGGNGAETVTYGVVCTGHHSPSARLCSDVDFPVNGFPTKLAFRRKWGKLGGAGGGCGGSTRSRRRYTTRERMGLGGRGSCPGKDSGGHQSHNTFCGCMYVCNIIISVQYLHIELYIQLSVQAIQSCCFFFFLFRSCMVTFRAPGQLDFHLDIRMK